MLCPPSPTVHHSSCSLPPSFLGCVNGFFPFFPSPEKLAPKFHSGPGDRFFPSPENPFHPPIGIPIPASGMDKAPRRGSNQRASSSTCRRKALTFAWDRPLGAGAIAVLDVAVLWRLCADGEGRGVMWLLRVPGDAVLPMVGLMSSSKYRSCDARLADDAPPLTDWVGVRRGSSPPMQIKRMPHWSWRMTKTTPLSSWTVTAGKAPRLLRRLAVLELGTGLLLLLLWVSEKRGGAGWWRAQREAATAHWRRRMLAGRLLACTRRLPAGVVRTAARMRSERLARRKAVTRFVKKRGGGGGTTAADGAILKALFPVFGEIVRRLVGGEGGGWRGWGGGLEGQQRSSGRLESVVGGAGFVGKWQAVTTATCVREALALGEELVLRFEDGRELAVMEVESEAPLPKRDAGKEKREVKGNKANKRWQAYLAS